MFDSRYTPIDLKETNFFKPLRLSNNIILKHRGVMPPLTRLRNVPGNTYDLSIEYTKTPEWKSFVSNPKNKTGEKIRGLAEEYYYQRSQKEGTLIIIEGTIISERAGGVSTAPGIFNETQVENLSKIVDSIHENKSYAVQQIVALGRQADAEYLKSKNLKYMAPSAVYVSENDRYQTKIKSERSGNQLRECTLQDLQNIKDDFVFSAKKALDAGCDAVEIHGANGYLLNQFLDKKTNKRLDIYGTQNNENRARYFLEVFDAVVAAHGAEKVAIRLSPFGLMGDMTAASDPDDTVQFYKYLYSELEKRRVDGKGPLYLSLIEPRTDEIDLSKDNKKVSNEFVFENFKGVVIRAGNFILDKEFTKKTIDQNDRTLLAFGRYFISNPDLIERLEQGLEINEYDRNTFYTGGMHGYIDYKYYQ
ncbi:hypothetical protein ACO0R3_000313 [Hanseniaspora guilliermondii]